ncbi:MAG: hypothetical protein WCO45_07395 [Pseudanabaena sp. ELA607]|jgi:hypothetical protein
MQIAEAAQSINTENNQQDVVVKIQLSGGHTHVLAMKTDTPLLRSLLGTVLAKVQGNDNRTLFQIPIEAGRAAICFSSADLVAVITEPPVYIRPNEENESAPPA